MKLPGKRLLSLSKIEEGAPEQPDVKTSLELETLKNAQLETKLKTTELWTGRANLAGRTIFSVGIFGLMFWWLLFVKEVIMLVAKNQAHLSDTVLIALITTTTANVLGLWAIVANYLYQKGKLAEAAKQPAGKSRWKSGGD